MPSSAFRTASTTSQSLTESAYGRSRNALIGLSHCKGTPCSPFSPLDLQPASGVDRFRLPRTAPEAPFRLFRRRQLPTSQGLAGLPGIISRTRMASAGGSRCFGSTCGPRGGADHSAGESSPEEAARQRSDGDHSPSGTGPALRDADPTRCGTTSPRRFIRAAPPHRPPPRPPRCPPRPAAYPPDRAALGAPSSDDRANGGAPRG
jgi:hypothetical protein